MQGSDNPYHPPPAIDEKARPWGDWFWGFFRRASAHAEFMHGGPIIFYGVVFFLQPGEDDFLHAALPLTDVSQKNIQRNVDEVLRVLPEFLDEHPKLRPHAMRSLMIRAVAGYQDLQNELCPRVITNQHHP